MFGATCRGGEAGAAYRERAAPSPFGRMKVFGGAFFVARKTRACGRFAPRVLRSGLRGSRKAVIMVPVGVSFLIRCPLTIGAGLRMPRAKKTGRGSKQVNK
jgi:hypothetical protein